MVYDCDHVNRILWISYIIKMVEFCKRRRKLTWRTCESAILDPKVEDFFFFVKMAKKKVETKLKKSNMSTSINALKTLDIIKIMKQVKNDRPNDQTKSQGNQKITSRWRIKRTKCF